MMRRVDDAACGVIYLPLYWTCISMSFSLHMQLNSGFTTPPSVGRCMPGAPFSDEFERHERVFVVGEHDDTFVYHLHLGSDSKVFKFICFYVLSCINIEHEYLSVICASYNLMHSHSFWIHQTTDKNAVSDTDAIADDDTTVVFSLWLWLAYNDATSQRSCPV